jgi:DNA-binding LytR/AlgR family response regulator
MGAFFTQLKQSKKYAAEAATLHLPKTHPTLAAPVTFTGDNQKETLTLQADQIAYLAARDNYVQIFFFEKEELKSKIFRATLRKMEDALADWPQFFRCHRTYVVNFDKIEKVSGNAQGYRFHLTDLEETIPVSRNLNEAVRLRLNA